MTRLSLTLAAIVSLLSLPAAAEPPAPSQGAGDPFPAGETDARRRALGVALAQLEQDVAKLSDALQVIGVVGAGPELPGKVAAYRRAAHPARVQSAKLLTAAKTAKVSPKVVGAIAALSQHAKATAAHASKLDGKISKASLAEAGRLVRIVVRDKGDVAGLVEPIVFR
ncbi:MAG: hypothetical protein KC731_43100 [Myxococcales bacterium]|nr:hypothetical protein [Myxococcales bacterium]